MISEFSKKRRRLLIEEMSRQEEKGLNCLNCSGGNCCTFELNSMMITPLESLEILAYLHGQGQSEQELREILQANIKKWGLDRPVPGNGRRSMMRRTYTCPFFGHRSLGCGLSRFVKPLGCLAFNPTRNNSVDPTHCLSDQSLLKGQWDEILTLSSVDDQLVGFEWEKLSIPQALLDTMHRVGFAEIPNLLAQLTLK